METHQSVHGEQKPEPSIEKSLKYIANYQKFNMKDDICEALTPLVAAVERLANAVLEVGNGGR